MNKFAQSKKIKPHNERGFALVLSLALISFVFLLVITLVSQVRQDMAYSDARENLILAKANARMGMMIAIGEIQKHLGPDMRISTSADIYDERLDSFISGISDRVDLNGNGNTVPDELPEGQRMWTGVWMHRGIGSENHAHEEDKRKTYPLPFNSDNASWLPESWSADSSYDHHPAVEISWLVSGNEGKKLGLFDKNGKIIDHVEVPDGRPIIDDQARMLPLGAGNEYGMHENPWRDHQSFVKEKIKTYYHPLLELPDPDSNDTITWLLKSDHNNIELKRRNSVKVPKEPIFLKEQKSSWENRSGAYAYWVSDEGIKTKINFNHSIPISDESKLAASPYPNIGSGSFELDSQDTSLICGSSVNSLSLLLKDDEDNNWKDFISKHYHDLTTTSFGVLADLRTGGLKRDLSSAFGQIENPFIRNDFVGNFLFRERIVYKKNIPLFQKSVIRNKWLTESAASIEDDNVLLAGPRWSVLADFHNLHTKDENLTLEAPTPFPRIVGDNSVIFNGNPRDGKGNLVINKDNILFFNVGDDPKMRHRPEPQNHSLLPVLLKLRMAVCPVKLEEENNLYVSIMPKIMLWNPYDKPLVLKDLFFEVPATIESEAFVIDLKEYDLYRKWWAAFYAIDQYDGVSYYDDPLSPLYGFPRKLSANFKNYFEFEKDYGLPENDINAYPGVLGERPIAMNQPIIDSPVKAFEDNSFPPQSYVHELTYTKLKGGMWSKGLPPASLYVEKRVDSDAYNSIWHENSDYNFLRDPSPNSGDPKPQFTFYSYKKNSTKINKLRLQIVDDNYDSRTVVLEPGEVANFSCTYPFMQEPNRFRLDKKLNKYPTQFANEEEQHLDQLIIEVCKGANDGVEMGFLWENNFYSKTKICRSKVRLSGMNAMSKNAAEKFVYNKSSDKFDKQQPAGYDQTTSLAMYEGDVTIAYDTTKQNSPKLLTRYSNWSSTGIEKSIYSTNDFLEQNFDKLGDPKQPGWGWEIEVKMPGHKDNERIILNEFNVRALVHSSQQGKGIWFSGESKFESEQEEFQELFDPIYDTSQTQEHTNYGGEERTFDYGKWPHFYEIPRYYPLNNPPSTQDVGTLKSLAFSKFEEALSKLNNSSDSNNERAISLKFDTQYPDDFDQSKVMLGGPDANTLGEAKIQRADSYAAKIGFFLESFEDDPDNKFYNEIISRSSTAVLFETPRKKPLSILQLRHANLNTHLHAPNYALGNSYATTQVARHRSWARINHIEEEPSNKFEMGSLSENIQLQDDGVKWATNLYKKIYPPTGTRDRRWATALDAHFKKREKASTDRFYHIHDENTKYIHWPNIDPEEGYKPWRSNEGSSSHQNIAIDHSFYLNRALLDGYFLTGAASYDDNMSIADASSPLRFYPYIWDSSSYGNSRLVQYLRSTSYNTYIRNGAYDAFFYNGEKNEDSQNSNLDGFLSENYSSYSNRTGYSMLHHLHKGSENKTKKNQGLFYQTVAGDLLLEGAFNINSTSIDSWIAQLSSLRGVAMQNATVNTNETPVARFTREPSLSQEDTWNKLRRLSDEEIHTLSKEIVRQVKLRGPFLSFSDFVNRSLIPGPNVPGKSKITNFSTLSTRDWVSETEDSVTGLRGAVQSAIAMSGLNDPEDSSITAWINRNKLIPSIPAERWSEDNEKFHDSSFGLLATSLQLPLWPDSDKNRSVGIPKDEIYNDFKTQTDDGPGEVKDHRIVYPGQSFGDAPENILAVESLATGAARPGWVMQADILAPLAPSLSARSDTFTVRVMGETNSKSGAKSWIEIVVQRTPDYVKLDIDAPHHRPHEKFMDQNLNGYWDEAIDEPWTNLNYNKTDFPDLPGDKNSHYRDGMPSDLSLNLDPQEEDVNSIKGISIFGINQRFGRKFRIVSFRWLREQDV